MTGPTGTAHGAKRETIRVLRAPEGYHTSEGARSSWSTEDRAYLPHHAPPLEATRLLSRNLIRLGIRPDQGATNFGSPRCGLDLTTRSHVGA